MFIVFFFFSSRRRHTRSLCDWSSDVCSSDLESSATVEYGDRRLESVEVSGLSAQWVEVNGGDVHPGRTFTRLEDLANDAVAVIDRKSTRLNSSHTVISYAVFCLKKKNTHAAI